MPSDRLERLAAELIAVAEQMRRDPARQAAQSLEGEAPDPGVSAAPQTAARAGTLERWCELATRLYRFRRRRDRLFGPLFGEPAWDILLDLFIMEAKGKRVPVSSACIASGASHSTALRQIDELVRRALVLRERDELDKRRTYVRLSDEGMSKMVLAMEQLSSHSEMRLPDMLASSQVLVG